MQWHLLRTKAGAERHTEKWVRRIAADVLLPLARAKVFRSGRMVESVTALFPCYLFALVDAQREHTNLRYTRGLREVVSFGGTPAIVPDWIIGELKQRCAQGPIELARRMPSPGEHVEVVEGPFCGLQGIFQRHVSGSERIAILLSVMGGARAVLTANMVTPVA